jgi:hypothetical protein
MTRPRKFLGPALILSTRAVVLFAARALHNPATAGAPLTSWLQQHWQTGTMETQRVAEIDR